MKIDAEFVRAFRAKFSDEPMALAVLDELMAYTGLRDHVLIIKAPLQVFALLVLRKAMRGVFDVAVTNKVMAHLRGLREPRDRDTVAICFASDEEMQRFLSAIPSGAKIPFENSLETLARLVEAYAKEA